MKEGWRVGELVGQALTVDYSVNEYGLSPHAGFGPSGLWLWYIDSFFFFFFFFLLTCDIRLNIN
jgi:hypothetical protein